MDLIQLSSIDLSLAAILVLALAAVSFQLKLGVGQRILIAGSRAALQLMLVGLVLKTLFEQTRPDLILGVTLFMLIIAGYEVMARQDRRFSGLWGIGIGTVSMFISSFSVGLFALIVVIQVDPWYTPQYLIPLIGMLLGNTMSGIAIALQTLTQSVSRDRGNIEARLMLGQDWNQAISRLRRDALRAGLIPIVNAMAAAGIVSLPGMMTGQILAGSPPLEAAKYQLLILLLVTAGTGFGAGLAVWLSSRRLFDERQRLRLDRLTPEKES